MLAEKEYIIQKLDQSLLAEEAERMGLTKPFKDNFERYSTLNNFGFMFGIFDQVVKDFLTCISKSKFHDMMVLEIGCAYGNVALEAVRRGCKNYLASDISLDHLRVFARTLEEIRKASYTKAISLIRAKFPEELDLPKESINLGLMNKVMHFFSPNEIEKAMAKINYITAPKGKWFVLTVSPNCKDFRGFSEEYSKRKRARIKDHGFCSNVSQYCFNTETTNKLPSSMYFFELDDLVNLFESNGFKILKTYSVDMPSNDNRSWNAGNDMVGIIAEKI